MTTLANEIPFPLPQGRRDQVFREQDNPENTITKGAARPVGPEEKAKHREAIRKVIHLATACKPHNPFPVAVMWDESLCREHPDFAPLLKTVDESLAQARSLRDLVEAVNRQDVLTICRLWDPGLQGVSYMSQAQQGVVRDSIVTHALGELTLTPHCIDPLVFKGSCVEVRWAWPRTYRWLFAVAVRNTRYPRDTDDVSAASNTVIRTAEQCRDGVAIEFLGRFPHACIWPAVTFEKTILCGKSPLRFYSRRPMNGKELR